MPNLSDLEIEALRKLADGEATIEPRLRLRLEMLGLIRDRAAGVFLTEDGRRAASRSSSLEALTLEPHHADFDKRGRRKPHQRRSVL